MRLFFYIFNVLYIVRKRINVLKILKKYIEFINEELKYLLPPTDEETEDALNKMSSQEIYKNCIKYDLGEKSFQKAVDKGLFNENTSPNTMLLIAGQCGSLNYIKKALKNGADVNFNSSDINPVLIKSSQKGRLDIVKYLIEKCEADVNIKTKHDYTLLMSACNGDVEHLDIVKYLVEHGANINYTNDNFNNNALSYAISNDYYSSAEYLIKNGADLELKDGDNNTPLMNAIENNNLELVKLLVENGADTKRIFYGEDLITIANKNNFTDIENYLKNVQKEK